MGIPSSLPSPKPRSLATAARRRPARPQASSEERQLSVHAGTGSPMTSPRRWSGAPPRRDSVDCLKKACGVSQRIEGPSVERTEEGPPDTNEPDRPDAEPVASPDRSQQSEVRRPDHETPGPSREAIGDRGVVVIQRFSRHRQTGQITAVDRGGPWSREGLEVLSLLSATRLEARGRHDRDPTPRRAPVADLHPQQTTMQSTGRSQIDGPWLLGPPSGHRSIIPNR